jgi:putative transposase
MHLKLDRLITENVNGIKMQIYTALIAHLLLQLLDIPQMWGTKLLDKLRYLQAYMSYEGSYAHWIERILNPNQTQPQPCAWTH